MNWVALASAGFVATTLTLAFFALVRILGWTTLDPTGAVGASLTRRAGHPLSDTVGFALLLLIGSTALPALFATALSSWSGPAAAGGAILGGFLGLLIGLGITLYGTISAQSWRSTRDGPGPYGIGWGKPTPALIVAGSMLYGAVVAAVLAGF